MSAPAGGLWLSLCRYRVVLLGLAAVLCAASSGCVQRRMMIRSNPPGARVYADDYEIGTTPVAHHFTYYGTRKIRLVKDGYETLVVYQPIPTPWYQVMPLDFLTENLLPGELRDCRTVTYQMVPQKVVPPDELLGRAEDLRARSAPLAPVAPGSVGWPGIGGMPTHPLPPGAQ